MMKLKVGDQIKVTSGKDKGREGTIEKVLLKEGKVIVPGVNIYKKHVKAQMTVDKKGGIFEIPRALSVAKVALVCPHCKKTTRIGFSIKDNKKERICKKCNKTI